MHHILLFLLIAGLFPVVLRVTAAAFLCCHFASDHVHLDDLLLELLELPLSYSCIDHAMAADFDPDVEYVGHHGVQYVELHDELFLARCLHDLV